MLAALLFTQAAMALAACEMPERGAARALMQRDSMPCHEDPAPNPNLCVAHCTSSDQSADTPQIAIPAWIGESPLVIVGFQPASGCLATFEYTLARPGAPPPRILFQSFLI